MRTIYNLLEWFAVGSNNIQLLFHALRPFVTKQRFIDFVVHDKGKLVRVKYGAVSYWSVVIPLTLLSAFLLLTKPRSSMPKNTIEPIPSDGT